MTNIFTVMCNTYAKMENGEYATQSKGARPNQRYVVILAFTETL